MSEATEQKRKQETYRLLEAGICHRIQAQVVRVLDNIDVPTATSVMWMAIKSDIRTNIIIPLQECGLIDDCMFDINIWQSGFIYVETRVFWPSLSVAHQARMDDLERRVAKLENANTGKQTSPRENDDDSN